MFAFYGRMCYNGGMVSVTLRPRAGCRFYFEVNDGARVCGGGLGEDGFLFGGEGCPYKDLLLRTLVNKCMNDPCGPVYARAEWGEDLRPFGFREREDGVFVSSWEEMRLPSGCGH